MKHQIKLTMMVGLRMTDQIHFCSSPSALGLWETVRLKSEKVVTLVEHSRGWLHP